MLWVTLDPSSFSLSRREQAALAGVTVGQFARVLREPRYQAAVQEVTMRRLAERIPAIMAARIQTAMLPGKEGFPDAQMLFKMAGLIDREGRPSIDFLAGDWGAEIGERKAQEIATALAQELQAAAQRRADAAREAARPENQQAVVIDAQSALIDPDAAKSADPALSSMMRGTPTTADGFLDDDEAPAGSTAADLDVADGAKRSGETIEEEAARRMAAITGRPASR